MEKKILETYKNRFINFSGRNQTLCRSRISSSRAFDIFKINKGIENAAENILLSLIKDNDKEHKLTNRSNDLKLSKKEKKDIKDNLGKYLELKIIKEEFSKEEIFKIENYANSSLREKSIKLIEKYKIEEKIAYQHSITKNLDKLFNNIDEKERETGLYELYTGYPFLEGKLLDGKTVRAPLFLFPTQIYKKDGEWYYKNLNKDKIYLNKVFLMAYKETNEISIDHIEVEFEEVEEFFKSCEKINSISDFQRYCQLWGEENNIKINNSTFTEELEQLKDYKKESYKIYENGEIYLKNHLILGEYSIGSNSIFKEFEKMEKLLETGELSKSIKDFLIFDTETLASDIGIVDFQNEISQINENESFFVTELDYSQEKAVKMAEKLDNLVIYGPPGTGKSQVIANIVSDYLAKNKKILIVSEKRTALDVVYKRLEKIGLSNKLAFAHDGKKDRDSIMNKIIQNHLKASEKGDSNSSSINLQSNKISEKIKSLDILAKELHITRDIGVSLYKLYTHCKLNSKTLDDISLNFSSYDFFNFESLNQFVNKLCKIEDFVKFDVVDNDISLRKNFSNISKIENKHLIQSLKNVNQFLSIKSYSFYEKELKEIIDNLDFKAFYKNKYQENIEIFNNIEEICSNLNKYEKTFFLSIKRFFIKRKLKKYFLDKNIENKRKLIISLKKDKDHYDILNLKLSDNNLDIISKIELLLENKIIEESESDFYNKLEILKCLNKNIEQIESYFSSDFIDKLYIENKPYDLTPLIDVIINNFDDIRFYDSKKLEFSNEELTLLEHYISNINNKDYLDQLKNTYFFKWIQAIEDKVSSELNVIYEYDTIKTKIFDLIQEKKKLVPNYIEDVINRKIQSNFKYNRVGNEVFYRSLITEANKKRKKLTLRKYIETFKEKGLFDLIPCWLLTPEMVSEILPFEKEFFDIVIFDEASQMFVEKSLPSIYRAKKVVVAGDDKQLKPNAIGQKRIEESEESEESEELEEYMDTSAITVESLLDLAKERFQSTLLSYHYRSKYPELINFSNYAFYNGNLITAPNNQELNKPAIEVIKIDNGVWEGQSNFNEAIKVYELVKELLLSRKNNESIGIITFNAKQQSLIKEYLDDVCENDIDFRNIYEKEKVRYDDNEDQSLFVKNIENVQGDERDIIIFSTAYAKDVKTGRIVNHFGTLSQQGGENRLNVAISRSKKKIYVITSIEPEDLNVENTKNNGPKLLKKYLQYARSISEKNLKLSKDILDSLDRIQQVQAINKDHFDSPFEIEVCEKLREKNYVVHTQVGDSGYKIDLAIYDEKNSDYILGIECDGATYHSSPSARERDVYRQKFLELKGWKIHRIWSRNWWENPHKEIEKIVKKIEKITH